MWRPIPKCCQVNSLDMPMKGILFSFFFLTQVTGYVLIANVFVKNVTLTSLTLIRGDTLFKPPVQVRINGTNTTRNAQKQSKGYALFVSLNFKASSNAIGMRLLGLSSLTGREIFKF